MNRATTGAIGDSNQIDVSTLGLIGLLCSRVVLFAAFQLIIALALNSWHESEKYWMLVATLVNVLSIGLLILLFKKEGKNYFELLKIDRIYWKKDLRLFLGLTIVLIVLALAPNYFLSRLFWSDPGIPSRILFQPVPITLTYFLLLAFPLTIALAELTTYFGYLMPRLEERFQKKWLAVLLPVIFLSVQHCTLPLILDPLFIIYRGLMYFPFALFIGIAIAKRHRLLPYFIVLHGLMDMQAVILLLMEVG